MKRVLLTGAAGIVGTAIRPLLAERFEAILLTDLEPIDDIAENEAFEQGDLADYEFLSRISLQADGIIHLGGKVGPTFTFHGVLESNIIGTQNVFESAWRSGISHVVYASSHHAVGFLKRTDRIDHTTAPRPDSFYGLSKAFGEETGSYYAHRHGINVLAIRIGYVGEQVIDERRLHTWCSPRDLMQLIEIGLTTPDLGYEIVYGVSEAPDPFFDNAHAERLGYRPRDRAIDHLADPELLNAQPDPGTAEGTYIGGHFCDA